MLLLFLAVLTVLLLKDDEVEVSSSKEKKPREILDPEVPLPPSPAMLHTFQQAAVSSDSQVCSELARWGCRRHWLDVSLSLLLHVSNVSERFFFILIEMQNWFAIEDRKVIANHDKSQRFSATFDEKITARHKCESCLLFSIVLNTLKHVFVFQMSFVYKQRMLNNIFKSLADSFNANAELNKFRVNRFNRGESDSY